MRAELLEMRRKMPFEEVFQRSSFIQKRFLDSGVFRAARRLSLYSSFRNEVLTDEVFQRSADEGREVYYPRVIRSEKPHLAFFRVGHLSELAPGSYEIPEPEEHEAKSDPDTFDIVVVPGIAFDVRGGRIGYGKGYYDMALKEYKKPVVALAYDFQVLNEAIPIEPHDIKVSVIVTEKRVIKL